MKKNLTKKLMLSVLTLAFAVVSLGASTFAWFTVGGTQQEAKFDATVVNGVGLDIAFTKVGEQPTAWNSAGSLASDALESLINQLNGNEWQMNAVTPSAAPALATATKFVGVDGKEIEKAYIEFDMHFKLTDTTSPNTYTVFMEEFAIASENLTKWKCDNSFNVKKTEGVEELTLNGENEFNILSAIRVSFNATDATEAINGIYEQAEDVSKISKTKVEEKDVVTVSNGYNTKGASADTEKGAFQYYVKKTQTTPTFNGITATTKDLVASENKVNLSAPTQMGKLAGSNQIKVSVRLWVEGWDAECLNAIFAQKINASMSIALRDESGKKLPA